MTYARSQPWAKLRPAWDALSRRRKTIWIVAGLWAALHVCALAGNILLMSDYTPDEIREWSDVVAYLDAGAAYRERAPLYELDTWEDPMTYYYHPVFALAASVVINLPFRLVSIIWLAAQIAAYVGALAVWYRLLHDLNLRAEAAAYVRWLPLALVFTELYVNLMYGNLTPLLLLLSGSLALLLLHERPGWAALVALPILLVKPQWLFPLLLPVIMRRWRLLILTGVLIAAGYLVINGLYVLAVGTQYGGDTLHDYATFLTTVNSNYEWGGHTYAFENFNHSWRQILLSYLGNHTWIPALSETIKVVMLVPVVWLIWRIWHTPQALTRRPQIVYWMAGLGYLLAMAMLAQLWEVLGSLVFFLALTAVPYPFLRRIVWVYLVYALYELPALVGFVVGWDALILPQSVPLSMMALLLMYGLLIAVVHQELAQAQVMVKGHDG